MNITNLVISVTIFILIYLFQFKILPSDRVGLGYVFSGGIIIVPILIGALINFILNIKSNLRSKIMSIVLYFIVSWILFAFLLVVFNLNPLN